MNDLSKKLFLGITAAALTATPISAQTSAAKPSATAKPQAVSTAREASSGMATGRQAQSGMATGREAQSGMASGREAQSGMATGRQTAQAPSASDAKNSGHATEKLEYKDPEDMTTRARPGNHKVSEVEADVRGGGTAAAAADKTKQTGLPACDGASKDAAKCAAAPASGSQAMTRVNKVESFTVKQ